MTLMSVLAYGFGGLFLLLVVAIAIQHLAAKSEQGTISQRRPPA